MAKSSIHLQTAKGGTILHNARENYSKSVVFTDEKNELWNDSKTAFKLFRDELEIRTKAYTERTGQKLHKTTSTMISGVVNLEQKHTLKDMEKIKDYLEKEFDTKVIQMSVHRDEGKLINKENEDLKLVSGKDFFLNAKDNELYFDNKFTKKINMNEWKIEKNYHGHFEMLGLDTQGKTLRKKMNIVKLSKLQDFTAQSLGMERTLSNVIVNEKGKAQRKSTTNKKRLDTNEFKEQAKIINETKKDLVSEKDLKKQIQELKKELQEEKAKRPDYAKLEDMNKTLLEGVKEKTLTISNFKIEIDTYKKEREQLKKEIDNLTVKNKDNIERLIKRDKEIIGLKTLTKDLATESTQNFTEYQKVKLELDTLKTQNKSLQEENKQKPIQTIGEDEKTVLKQFTNDLTISMQKEIKKEIVTVKTGLLKSEDKEMNIINEPNSLFQNINKSFFNQFNKLFELAKAKAKKFYEDIIKSKDTEISELKEKNKELLNSNFNKDKKIERLEKSLSLTGEKKESNLDKIISNYDKMKAKELDLKDILNINKEDLKEAQDNLKELLEKDKQEKDQEEVKENTKPKQQYRGYELG